MKEWKQSLIGKCYTMDEAMQWVKKFYDMYKIDPVHVYYRKDSDKFALHRERDEYEESGDSSKYLGAFSGTNEGVVAIAESMDRKRDERFAARMKERSKS